MKWPTNQFDSLVLKTLKVIFYVPNSTRVERYLKRWEKIFMLSKKSENPLNREGLSFDMMKLNKEIQAERFKGTIFDKPTVPL